MKIIKVYNCWDCPYMRQGKYCDNDKTRNMDISGAIEKNQIHPECALESGDRLLQIEHQWLRERGRA
jgi:hypothetical protein